MENQLSGVVNWKCPSNIAIIKYWGKYGAQLPRNPSISFTLDACYSITTIRYRGKTDSDSSIRFRFDGQENAKWTHLNYEDGEAEVVTEKIKSSL